MDSIPTVSYAELEAFHDVLEAARCWWHSKPETARRATETLRLANQAFWRLGEELSKTGTPSERFRPVSHSSDDSDVDALIDFVVQVTSEYTRAHDPWWADTIVAPKRLEAQLSRNDLTKLRDSLSRLGLKLEFSHTLQDDQLIADRRNWGPWA